MEAEGWQKMGKAWNTYHVNYGRWTRGGLCTHPNKYSPHVTRSKGDEVMACQCYAPPSPLATLNTVVTTNTITLFEHFLVKGFLKVACNMTIL